MVSAEERVQAAQDRLRSAGTSLRCRDVVRVLTDLGFDVRDGKAANHKIYNHVGLPRFFGSAFACEHGRNPEILSPYVTRVRKVLLEHESDLIQYLRELQ